MQDCVSLATLSKHLPIQQGTFGREPSQGPIPTITCFLFTPPYVDELRKDLREQITLVIAKWPKPKHRSSYKRRSCNASFTEQEFRKLKAAADKARAKPSAHLREIALAYLGNNRISPEEIAPTRAKIRKLANTLRIEKREHLAQELFDLELDLIALIKA